MARQLANAALDGVGTARHLIWPSLMRGTSRTGGLGAPNPSLFLFQRLVR